MLGWRTETASAGGRRAAWRSSLLFEDRAHRAVGERADLDGARGRRFETLGAERPHQAHDAETGTEALFGMRPALQDQLAQSRRGGAGSRCLGGKAPHGPVGIV